MEVCVLEATAQQLEYKPTDHLKAEVICGLFNAMNTVVFDDEHRTRFTLFLPSPSNPDRIIPWCRFYKGSSDPFVEAQMSKASYKRGESYTGKAWEEPHTLIASLFPHFASRGEFEKYYTDRLGIVANDVKNISDYMIGVRTIFAYGFTDCFGRLTGVLSLDAQKLLGSIQTEITPLGTERITQEIHDLDIQQLRPLIGVLNTILESLHIPTRR
jgi:hypothetical protein